LGADPDRLHPGPAPPCTGGHDWTSEGRRTTRWCPSAETEPEYPRRMHCIQGSDAPTVGPGTRRMRPAWLGDRVKPKSSFRGELSKAIKAVFIGEDFSGPGPTAPPRLPSTTSSSHARLAPTSFRRVHEGWSRVGGRLTARSSGMWWPWPTPTAARIYVGVRATQDAVVGVCRRSRRGNLGDSRPRSSSRSCRNWESEVTSIETQGRQVVQISVPAGPDVPYAIDGTTIYLRQEAETTSPCGRDRGPRPSQGPGGAAARCEGACDRRSACTAGGSGDTRHRSADPGIRGAQRGSLSIR